jgi:hypothetical protein
MGFLAVLLLPAFSPPGTHLAAVLFAIPFLAGFARDWLIAAGLMVGAGLRPAPTMQFAARWAPVVLRLAVAGLMAGPLAARFLDAPAQASFYASRGMPSPGTGVLVLGLLEAAVLALLLLGAAGRIAAIAALCLLGVNQVYAGLTPAQNILAALFTAILYLGTGALSLWKPEDRFIHYRGGESVPYGVEYAVSGGEPVILSKGEG